MFAEYLPFTIKYLYHIIIGIVSFILLKKFFEHSVERTVQSGTSILTEESTESSESNVVADIFTYTRRCISVSYIRFILEKIRERMVKNTRPFHLKS